VFADEGQYDINQFVSIIDNINKGNYGKISDDALLGDSADFNESLGGLANLDMMNAALANLKKKGS